MTIAQRKAFFKRAANRAGRVWSTDLVLTMHVFDHTFDFHQCCMLMPLMHFDMVRRGCQARVWGWPSLTRAADRVAGCAARVPLLSAIPHRSSLNIDAPSHAPRPNHPRPTPHPQVHVMDGQPVEVSLLDKACNEWAFRFEVRGRPGLLGRRGPGAGAPVPATVPGRRPPWSRYSRGLSAPPPSAFTQAYP
jgi:hypothetical protein